MPTIETNICCICASQRKETNRWFIGFLPIIAEGVEIPLELYSFSIERARFSKAQLLCGEACTIKFISQNLNSLHPEEVAASSKAQNISPEWSDEEVAIFESSLFVREPDFYIDAELDYEINQANAYRNDLENQDRFVREPDSYL